MNRMQVAVRDFLIKHLGAQPSGWPNRTSVFNKWLLIAEEFEELGDALGLSARITFDPLNEISHLEWWQARDVDAVAAIDAICDLLYVVFNLAEELEIDVQPFFDEVHRSNMTKGPGSMSAEQKILKGPGYQAPRLHELYEFYKQGKVFCKACNALGYRRAYADGKEILDNAGDPVLIDCPSCVRGLIPAQKPIKRTPAPAVEEPHDAAQS